MNQFYQFHDDEKKLQAIAGAMERVKGKGSLPSVRRDSPAWEAWRQWRLERGLSLRWSDRQLPDHKFTVISEYPPLDLDAELARWKGGGGAKPKLLTSETKHG